MAVSREREFHFTQSDFSWIRRRVSGQTGIELSPAKDQMVYSRLARRLRALGLPDFAAYRKFLEQDQGEEMGQFVNALTTNLTAFFREAHHFEHLAELLAQSQGTITIWSAGCSTGEEAYSIAITALETLGEAAPEQVRIVATDLDTSVVAKAEAGVYDAERVANLKPSQLKRYFLRGKGPNRGKVKVKPGLREMVEFRSLNLLEDWPFDTRFDVIFCRNVVIYFNKQLQAQLFERMFAQTKPGAILYIGHSETLWKVTERFEPQGRTVYQRVE